VLRITLRGRPPDRRFPGHRDGGEDPTIPATIDSWVRCTPERELGPLLLRVRLGCRRRGAELL